MPNYDLEYFKLCESAGRYAERLSQAGATVELSCEKDGKICVTVNSPSHQIDGTLKAKELYRINNTLSEIISWEGDFKFLHNLIAYIDVLYRRYIVNILRKFESGKLEYLGGSIFEYAE